MADQKTLAVIRSGGKQYIVFSGTKLRLERLPVKEGENVVFSEVLLVANGEKVSVGTPLVAGGKVSARVVAQGKHKKQIIFKMRPKKRYRVKTGHRQPFTEVEILKISH